VLGTDVPAMGLEVEVAVFRVAVRDCEEEALGKRGSPDSREHIVDRWY
jgi:hypothetical protein